MTASETVMTDRSLDELGPVDYLVVEEWARTAEDVLWRRTKCGLHMRDAEREAVEQHLSHRQTVAA